MEQLKPESSLDDIKRIAEILKADVESQSNAAKLRIGWLQSAAPILVPLVSLAALVATIAMQAYQLSLSRADQARQYEIQEQRRTDDQWNEFLKGVDPANSGYLSNPSLAPRLLFFLHNKSYNAQAIGVAKNILGNMSDHIGFEQIFGEVFIADQSGLRVNRDNLKDLVNIFKARMRTAGAVRIECLRLSNSIKKDDDEKYYGLCSLSEEKLIDTVRSRKEAGSLLTLQQARDELDQEHSFISKEVAKLLRHHSSQHQLNAALGSEVKVNLYGLELYDCDLSEINFSNVILDGVILDSTNLQDARITPTSPWKKPEIRASNWWMAKKINPEILEYLIVNKFPYYPTQGATNFEVDRSTYTDNIIRLCRESHTSACDAKLSFGERPEK